MWEVGKMRSHKDSKHISFYAFPEIKAALRRAVTHTSENGLEGTIEEGESRYENSHHIEAVVCWLLTQPQETQDRIILEGRIIARRLRALPEPAKDFPAAYIKPGGKPGSIRSAGSSVIDLDDREPDTQRRVGKRVKAGHGKRTPRGR